MLEVGSLFEVDGKPIARQGVGKGTRSCLLRHWRVLARVLSPIVGWHWYVGGTSTGCCSGARGWSQSSMYWGWGSHIVPSFGNRQGPRSGGSAQGSWFLFLQAAGKSPTRRCLFGSSLGLAFWGSRTTGSSLWTRSWRTMCLSWICCYRSRSSRRVGLSGRGSLGGTMSPRRMRHSWILWWKVKVIRAARKAMVAPTNADVNSSARSVISLFIGVLVIIG